MHVTSTTPCSCARISWISQRLKMVTSQGAIHAGYLKFCNPGGIFKILQHTSVQLEFLAYSGLHICFCWCWHVNTKYIHVRSLGVISIMIMASCMQLLPHFIPYLILHPGWQEVSYTIRKCIQSFPVNITILTSIYKKIGIIWAEWHGTLAPCRVSVTLGARGLVFHG